MLRSLSMLRLSATTSSAVRGSGLRWLSSVNTEAKEEPVIVEASKKNISQSPWKMNFLVTLARGKWYPDAMAQLKFSPKGKAPEVGALLARAANMAKIYHQTIPEELFVKEIFVTKGFAQKRMRIMGRGRTGFGYKRKTHVRVKLEKIDFGKMIAGAKTFSQKQKWKTRKSFVEGLKQESGDGSQATAAVSEAGEEGSQAEKKPET